MVVANKNRAPLLFAPSLLPPDLSNSVTGLCGRVTTCLFDFLNFF